MKEKAKHWMITTQKRVDLTGTFPRRNKTKLISLIFSSFLSPASSSPFYSDENLTQKHTAPREDNDTPVMLPVVSLWSRCALAACGISFAKWPLLCTNQTVIYKILNSCSASSITQEYKWVPKEMLRGYLDIY